MGGAKATAVLAGLPLIAHPIAAARAAGLEVVVVAKEASPLPALDVPVLYEPATPVHPLAGVLAGLREFPAILAIPCDMPFLTPALLASLAAAEGSAAVTDLRQPFPALLRRPVAATLERALASERSLRATFGALEPAIVPVADAGQLRSINSPGDLADAEALFAA